MKVLLNAALDLEQEIIASSRHRRQSRADGLTNLPPDSIPAAGVRSAGFLQSFRDTVEHKVQHNRGDGPHDDRRLENRL